MRAHYIIIFAATAIFASFGDASAIIGVGQNEISGMTAVGSGMVQPVKATPGYGNRFLRKRDAGEEAADGGQEEKEEEERGITDLAAKLDDTLTIKTLRRSIKRISQMLGITCKWLGFLRKNETPFCNSSRFQRTNVKLFCKQFQSKNGPPTSRWRPLTVIATLQYNQDSTKNLGCSNSTIHPSFHSKAFIPFS
ncbi:unnamed protein product [Phytophthora lilii]|uniref:RxLR effector protein n=1 Tax=Phytophthora lilii TaxID=2077276 RepID=A0A9W6TCV5_9STRA|nr:unnamed protein product [Phytophthora lilii]